MALAVHGIRQTIRFFYGVVFGGLVYLWVHGEAMRQQVTLGAIAGGIVFFVFVVGGEALEQRRLARAARSRAKAREQEIEAEERLRARVRREEEAASPRLYRPSDN